METQQRQIRSANVFNPFLRQLIFLTQVFPHLFRGIYMVNGIATVLESPEYPQRTPPVP